MASDSRPGLVGASNAYFGTSGLDAYGSTNISGSRWIPQIFAKKTL